MSSCTGISIPVLIVFTFISQVFVSFYHEGDFGIVFVEAFHVVGKRSNHNNNNIKNRIFQAPKRNNNNKRLNDFMIGVLPMSSSSSSSSSIEHDSDDGVASSARSLGLFLTTPLLLSRPLTDLMGDRNNPVYIKLDALQPSGSFKDRGMAHLCDTLHKGGTQKLISSSGGNAGLAVATVGGRLGMEVDVIVPKTTKALVIDKLKSLGADVTVHGENWNEADLMARQRVQEDATAEYVSPYDNPLLWHGHSTIIDELLQEIPKDTNNNNNDNVGAIVVSVGGGGLICGVLEGLHRHDRFDIGVVAAETEGAASFGKAWEKGELIRLDAIESVATSLGALEVTEEALIRAKAHEAKNGILQTAICTDKEAVEACVRFAQDHRILVEPACGAALAAVYSDRLRDQTFQNVDGAIIIEVCGGSGVNTELLESWKKQYL